MLKKQSIYWKRLLVLLVGLLVLLRVFRATNSPKKAIEEAFQGSKYSKLVPYILAQAKHETGNFTSFIYLRTNNMFGMGIPGSRNSLRSGKFISRDGREYSKFKSVLDSAKDFRLYLENQNFPVPLTEAGYVWELKNRGYFEDSYNNYLKGVRSWL
jgi:hypothetical protein